MKKEMGVAFDQSGNEGVVRQIDPACTGRRGNFRRRGDGADLVAGHEHGPTWVELLAVENGAWTEEDGSGRVGFFLGAGAREHDCNHTVEEGHDHAGECILLRPEGVAR